MEVRKIKDIKELSKLFEPRFKLAQFENTEVVVLGIKTRQGQISEYIEITCKLPDDEREFIIATGAKNVVDILTQAEPYFPVSCKFVRKPSQSGLAYWTIE